MNRWKALVTALTLCVGISGVALAQDSDHRWKRDNQRDQWGWQQDRDHDRDDRDRDRDRDPDRDRDRDRDRNHGDGNGGYYGNGQYGQYGPYGNYGRGRYGNQAAQIGYQDGLNDGRNDAAGGHSYRPTQDSNYRHADRGYSGAYGNKGAYQQAYRNAYMQGYQNGYGRGRYGYGNNAPYGGWPWGR